MAEALKKSSLEEIHTTRVNRLNDLMNKMEIPSIRQLCFLTGIQPAVLSRMLSENKLVEKHARTIEEHFNLPKLWLDIEEYNLKKNIPVFFFENFNDPDDKDQADFFIEKTINNGDFYIKLNERIGILSEGYFLLFKKINSIQSIKFDDICIIRHQKSARFYITQFKGNEFRTNDTSKKIQSHLVIAKCISIEI